MGDANGVEITILIFVIILTFFIVGVVVILGLVFAKVLETVMKTGEIPFTVQGTVSLGHKSKEPTPPPRERTFSLSTPNIS